MLPPPIFVKLHNYVFELITQPEVPEILIDPTLSVIAGISSDINEDIPEAFYQQQLLHAIDATAAILSSNLLAANAF